MRAELPGILAWAVRGCLDWQANGMQPPAAVRIATESYRSEQDPLADFIAEACLIGENMLAPNTKIFGAYSAWAKAAGMHDPMGHLEFLAHLRRAPNVGEGVRRVDGANTRVFTGIGIKTVANEYRQATEVAGRDGQ